MSMCCDDYVGSVNVGSFDRRYWALVKPGIQVDGGTVFRFEAKGGMSDECNPEFGHSLIEVPLGYGRSIVDQMLLTLI